MRGKEKYKPRMDEKLLLHSYYGDFFYEEYSIHTVLAEAAIGGRLHITFTKFSIAAVCAPIQ
jgi:hypothetical protein